MPGLDLTTAARVKVGLAIDVEDDTHDAWIATTISAVSVRIERFIDRELLLTERTQEFDIHNVAQAKIWLRTFPVVSIASVVNSASWEFSTTDQIDPTDYRVDSANGQVHFRVPLEVGPQAMEVTYTAGLALDSAGVINDWPDLASACDIQVAATFRRRSSPQGSASSTSGGELRQESPLKLIPDVRQTLLPLRRLRFGV